MLSFVTKKSIEKTKNSNFKFKNNFIKLQGYFKTHYENKQRERKFIMGWVVLTLRKTELKRTHSDYQMELLRISRRKRQMAREKHYNQTLIRNEQSSATRALKNLYNQQKDSINANGTYQDINNLFNIEDYTQTTGTNSVSSLMNSGYYDDDDYTPSGDTSSESGIEWGDNVTNYTKEAQEALQTQLAGQDFSNTSTSSSSSSLTSQEKLNLLDDAKEDYLYLSNEIKTMFEDELEMLEEEASDEETNIEQEQTEIEALLESITQEMDAVGQAISSQIQSGTIKLS